MYHLEFEKPIIELENKIMELESMNNLDINIQDDIKKLNEKVQKVLKQTYMDLTPDQKVQVARHPDRPQFTDYIARLIEDFTPLAGDRRFGEDAALIGGLGRFKGQSCVILGQERGRDTTSRIHHNFGAPRPEGYRKAQRLIKMASNFNIPVISLVDTAGAYPGINAEERGQAEAIAKSTEACLRAETPIISVIIGEGGSGGAIAIATADKVMMLEHSIYSVISPEGCASILWRSRDHAKEAAKALKITATDLKRFGIIDKIIPEPLGGAHRDAEATMDSVSKYIESELKNLIHVDGHALKIRRRNKFLNIGRKAA